MTRTFTREEVKKFFPCSDSVIGEDGITTVQFDDGRWQIQIDFKDKKLIGVFFRDRQTNKFSGVDFDLQKEQLDIPAEFDKIFKECWKDLLA